MNQPPFDGAIQFRSLPPSCSFSHSYPTRLAEEGSPHTPTQHTAKVSLITQDLNKQMLTSHPQALEMHAQTIMIIRQEMAQMTKDITPYLPELKGIKQIIKLPEGKLKDQWKSAIRKELATITECTFNLNGQPLVGEQILPLMFIFKVKMTSKGGLDKLKEGKTMC